MRYYLFFLLRLLFFAFFPFLVLVRASVYFYLSHHLNPWVSLFSGFLLSTLIFLFYALYWKYKLNLKPKSLKSVNWTYWIMFSVLLTYFIPAVFSLTSSNAKTPEVKEEYASLHPVLRLGIATILILDDDLVITDADRKPEDYWKMGLPTKEHSLHYKQLSGYVHAVDIRTKDRGGIKNFLVESYFRIMGFNTLRHVGTADHLHISITSPDRPLSI